MTKRDIFSELVEGFDALKSHREGKLTLRQVKVQAKPGTGQAQRTGRASDPDGGAVSGHGAAAGVGLSAQPSATAHHERQISRPRPAAGYLLEFCAATLESAGRAAADPLALKE